MSDHRGDDHYENAGHLVAAGGDEPDAAEEAGSEFFKRTNARNFPVVVQGVELWISREFLASYSPVFEHMFYNERFADSRQDRLVLPSKTLPEMIEFFDCLFPMPCVAEVTMHNVYRLLKLSDEYDVADLKARCRNVIETYLSKIEYGSLEQAEVWRVAKNCCAVGLMDVVANCIPFMAALPMQKINLWRRQLPDTVMAAVFQAKCNRLTLEASRDCHVNIGSKEKPTPPDGAATPKNRCQKCNRRKTGCSMCYKCDQYYCDECMQIYECNKEFCSESCTSDDCFCGYDEYDLNGVRYANAT